MKKWVLILLMLLLTLPGYALITIEKKPGTGTLSGHLDDINANDLELDGKIDGKVSDDAFTADWDEVTDVAPSQAALYNYLINFDADGDGLFSDEAWFPTIFDPAAPGEIGGTTASAGTFTDLSAGTLTLTPTDGENRLTFPENTTRTPASGAEEIFNEGGLMKYSENGVKKNFVTIDDTAGTGDTTVALSADKVVELIAAGGSVDDTAYDNSWDGDTTTAPSKNVLYDKIETLSAGAAPTIQAADPTSASSVGFYGATTSGDFFYKSSAGLFNITTGTYTADGYTLTLAVSGGGTVQVGSTQYGSFGSPHSISSLAGSTALTADYGEGGENIIVWSGTNAGDITGEYPDYAINMNAAKSVTATFIADDTDPVIVAAADSTHDGATAVNGACELTETNPANPAVTFTATGCTPTSGSCTGTYPNFTTPDLTPDGTDDIVVTFAAEDLAGNEATGTDLVQEFAYTGGGGPDVEDTFTDTDSTALASHTSDSAHTWTQNGGGTMQIYSNRVESTQSTSAGLYYSSFTPSDADYTVQMDSITSGSGIPIFVAGRCATAALTMYACRWNGTDTWELTRWVAGTRTVIGTYVGDSPIGTSRTVALIMTGTTIAVNIGGVERISVTDSSISTAGRPGIGTYYCDTSGSHIIYGDNYEVTD